MPSFCLNLINICLFQPYRLRQLCCHRELIRNEDGDAIDWGEVMRMGDQRQLQQQLVGQEGGGEDGDQDQEALRRQLRDMIRSGVTEDCSICLVSQIIPCNG